MNNGIKKNNIKKITAFFFLNAIIEVIAEAFAYKPLIFITKPLIPILICVLYFYKSKRKHKLFFFLMLFSLITNLFFIPNTQQALFYGVISFTIHRILLLILIFKIVNVKDYLPFILSTLPLVFIFFYLFPASIIPENSYYLIVFHSLIASLLGGIAFSCYYMDDNKRNTILLIAVILFLALQLVIYIEKYYFVDFSTHYLRPVAMFFNVVAFYMFYVFVVESEKPKYSV